MFFGPLATAEAIDCRLAHSLATASGRIRKGTRLDAEHLRALLGAGHSSVIVARPDHDDDDEDMAASRVAAALAGPGLRPSSASTGRVNLFTLDEGLLVLDREALLAANRVTEAITLATLAENVLVAEGRLVATVKIIPFAVPRRDVDTVIEGFRQSRDGPCTTAPLRLAALRPRSAALVHTTLPSLRDGVVAKTARITTERLARRRFELVHEGRCAHHEHALVNAIERALAERPELDSREGWREDRERFADSLETLEEQRPDLREELGDAAYDRYLYEQGGGNRVGVASVMSGSVAERAGLQSGDVIVSYAGERVFRLRDLQSATRAGSYGEPVQLSVRRDGEVVAVEVVRGPLGVSLSPTRREPG